MYYLPKEKFYGLEYIPQISNATNDEVYYEIGRFVELLLKNNPNILELLATPDDCILYKHPLMEKLQVNDFLSKLCKETFAGYAVTQIRKARGLNKKIVNPMPKEKKGLLDFCYVLEGYNTVALPLFLAQKNWSQQQCGLINLPNSKGIYALFYDESDSLGYKAVVQKETSNEVSLSSIPKGEQPIGYVSCNQEGYSKYCKEYSEYWDWVEKRNADRYETNQNHGKNYDSKNMMHTIRLLQTAEQILSKGTLNIRVDNREELLSIKAGEKEYDDLMRLADELMASIDTHCETSNLPELPNHQKAIQTLIEIREALYQ